MLNYYCYCFNDFFDQNSNFLIKQTIDANFAILFDHIWCWVHIHIHWESHKILSWNLGIHYTLHLVPISHRSIKSQRVLVLIVPKCPSFPTPLPFSYAAKLCDVSGGARERQCGGWGHEYAHELYPFLLSYVISYQHRTVVGYCLKFATSHTGGAITRVITNYICC